MDTLRFQFLRIFHWVKTIWRPNGHRGTFFSIVNIEIQKLDTLRIAKMYVSKKNHKHAWETPFPTKLVISSPSLYGNGLVWSILTVVGVVDGDTPEFLDCNWVLAKSWSLSYCLGIIPWSSRTAHHEQRCSNTNSSKQPQPPQQSS